MNLKELKGKTVGEAVNILKDYLDEHLSKLYDVGYPADDYYFQLADEGVNLDDTEIENWEDLHVKNIVIEKDWDVDDWNMVTIETEENIEDMLYGEY